MPAMRKILYKSQANIASVPLPQDNGAWGPGAVTGDYPMSDAFIPSAEIRMHAAIVPSDTLAAFREACANALTLKIESMLPRISAANLRKLENARSNVRAGVEDSAMRVMCAMGVPPDFFSRKVRGGDDMFNVYAIPKTFLAARNMLSDSPLYGSKGESATLRGTIQGLIEGAHNDPKTSLAAYLDKYMCERGAGAIPGHWHSGGTQSSSSCHALAALGFLSIPAQGKYVINDMAYNALLRLLGQEEEAPNGGAPAPDVTPVEAPQEAPKGKGNKGKGKAGKAGKGVKEAPVEAPAAA